jgi:hypothetical protein
MPCPCSHEAPLKCCESRCYLTSYSTSDSRLFLAVKRHKMTWKMIVRQASRETEFSLFTTAALGVRHSLVTSLLVAPTCVFWFEMRRIREILMINEEGLWLSPLYCTLHWRLIVFSWITVAKVSLWYNSTNFFLALVTSKQIWL